MCRTIIFHASLHCSLGEAMLVSRHTLGDTLWDWTVKIIKNKCLQISLFSLELFLHPICFICHCTPISPRFLLQNEE